MAAQLDAVCEPLDGGEQPRGVLVRVRTDGAHDDGEYAEHEFASAALAAQWAREQAAGSPAPQAGAVQRRGDAPEWVRRLEAGLRHVKTAHVAAHEWLAPRVAEVRDGLASLVTSSQAELLLGRDGAAALEHIMLIYREQLQGTLARTPRPGRCVEQARRESRSAVERR